MTNAILKILVIHTLLFGKCIAQSAKNGSQQKKKADDVGRVLSIRNAPDHWIAVSKRPASFPVTLSQSTTVSAATPTSAPFRYTSKRKNKKRDKNYNDKKDFSERRYSDGFTRYRQKYKYHDLVPEPEDYERYYYRTNTKPARKNSYLTKSSTFPSSSYHSLSSPGVSPIIGSVGTVYADSPAVSRFVVEDPSKYFVQRIQPGSYFIKPNRLKDNVYSSESQSVRRLDSLDYDDFVSGDRGLTGSRSITGFGPQSSFPPRQIMTKIAQPGQSQPCHGPECHQHHKGLVRFYWRRVVYPNDGRRRQRNRYPPMIARTQRRRRLRDRVISPSAQRGTYYQQNDEENENDDDEDNNEEDNNEDDGDEEEEGTRQYASWRPGRGYGLDLDEGYNYQDSEKKLYRDKRWTPKKM